MKVGACGAYPPNFGDNIPEALQGGVELYTILGIPYGELRFQCGGTESILCPQNTAECTQAGGATVGARRRSDVVAQKVPDATYVSASSIASAVEPPIPNKT